MSAILIRLTDYIALKEFLKQAYIVWEKEFLDGAKMNYDISQYIKKSKYSCESTTKMLLNNECATYLENVPLQIFQSICQHNFRTVLIYLKFPLKFPLSIK